MTRHSCDLQLELTPDELWSLASALSIVLNHIDEAHRARFEALAAKIAAMTMRAAEPTKSNWRTRANEVVCAQRLRLVKLAAR